MLARSLRWLVLSGALLSLTACETKIPQEALNLSPRSLELRQVQTRYFEASEQMVLSASAAVLQDLGFNLDESETALGLVVASKDRSARNAGQIVGSILLGALTGTFVPTDHHQKMRASLITAPMPGEGVRTSVRVTFQRIVWNDQNRISRLEGLTDPAIYQEFFSRLSKSLFLEAYQL